MTYRLTTMFLVMLMIFSQTQHADAIDAKVAGQSCNGCHGYNGISRGYSIPSIAGFNSRYFMRTMLRFRNGERRSTIMKRIAQGYKISELRKISDYFAKLEWINSIGEFNQNKVTEARKIHDELCAECHEDNGRYQDKEVPRISGQTANYLYIQLLDYHAGRPDMPQPEKMKERLESLTIEDLDALSQFYSSGG